MLLIVLRPTAIDYAWDPRIKEPVLRLLGLSTNSPTESSIDFDKEPLLAPVYFSYVVLNLYVIWSGCLPSPHIF